jgi:2-dehydropantoate 2-reductase
MGNAVFNPLSVLAKATLGEICRSLWRCSLAALVEDVLGVAFAAGRTPPVGVGGCVAGGERVGDHRTSMLQDLQAGQRLELDPQTSAVIEFAALAGVDVPRPRTLHAPTDVMVRRHGAR